MALGGLAVDTSRGSYAADASYTTEAFRGDMMLVSCAMRETVRIGACTPRCEVSEGMRESDPPEYEDLTGSGDAQGDGLVSWPGFVGVGVCVRVGIFVVFMRALLGT